MKTTLTLRRGTLTRTLTYTSRELAEQQAALHAQTNYWDEITVA